MNKPCQLSNVTKAYLDTYECIREEMIRGMTEVELADSISGNFIIQMIPHHRAAIEMSENLLKYTTNISLQEIALGIISEQTKSIEDMQRIQRSCGECKNDYKELCHYQNRINQVTQKMFCCMTNARFTNSVNCNFMWEMIPHHRGAVEMSKNALRYDICPELRPILEAIIRSQEQGIRRMCRLLQCIGC